MTLADLPADVRNYIQQDIEEWDDSVKCDIDVNGDGRRTVIVYSHLGEMHYHYDSDWNEWTLYHEDYFDDHW